MFRYLPRRPSRRMTLCAALILSAQITALGAVAQNPPVHGPLPGVPQWTLSEALESAFSHSPQLRALQAELKQVESGLVDAKIYPYNPELTLEIADRNGLGVSTTDYAVSLSQEVELAGQRRKRIAIADTELTAAGAALLREQNLLAFRVESAFAEAIRARELRSVAETDAALAQEVLDFSRLRLERGIATQIEVNLAQASAGRAQRSVQRSLATYTSACSRLAELAGLDPATPPEPLGDLVLPEDELPPLAELLERALENRGDLRSAGWQEQAAEAAIRLALAQRRPNLVVGGFFQREEATDEIFGVSVGVALPLLNRNQGRIAEARAIRERLGYEHDALRLTIEREVVSALSNLRAARAAAEYLRDQVLGTLEENIDLLQSSFAAGRIGATEVVTLRREFVASRREYVEALTDVWLARIDLDLSMGRLIPQTSSVKELP